MPLSGVASRGRRGRRRHLRGRRPGALRCRDASALTAALRVRPPLPRVRPHNLHLVAEVPRGPCEAHAESAPSPSCRPGRGAAAGAAGPGFLLGPASPRALFGPFFFGEAASRHSRRLRRRRRRCCGSPIPLPFVEGLVVAAFRAWGGRSAGGRGGACRQLVRSSGDLRRGPVDPAQAHLRMGAGA